MARSRTHLATKLFAAIGLTALLVIAVMTALIAYSMRDGFSQYLLRGELVGLDRIAGVLAREHDPDDPGWPKFRDDAEAWRVFVHRQFGLGPPQTFRPPPRPGGPPPVTERLVLLNPSGQRIAGYDLQTDQFERRAIVSPAGPGEEDEVLGWLGLYAPPGARNVTDAFYLRGQLRSLGLASLIAVLISAGAAFLLARQFLAPIHALESGAKVLARGDYGARIPNKRSDELGRLIDHYNGLAASLEAAEIAERRWISDTSHELQTPLAVLRAQIEAIQDGVRKPDDNTLASMHAAVQRLTRLVEDLRTLIRDREGGFALNPVLTDVAQILCDGADVARFQAAGLALTCKIDQPLMVTCDGQRLRQVIDNLFENSLRYTDAPGRATLSAWINGDDMHIELADSGPAPSTDSLPRLFDRFYRGEASRSRASGGAGLGLSICKTIVEAHGGQITANLSNMGGLAIHMTFPVQGPST